MELTNEQFDKISGHLPRQRRDVRISNHQLVNALLYVVENGCKWRSLPKSFGNWHTFYMRMNRWSHGGVLRKLFEVLQTEGITQIKMEAVCLDSTTVKVHPNGTGALKKEVNKASGDPAEDLPPKFIWPPRLTVRL